MNRRLSLKRERLSDLTPDALATVNAGVSVGCLTGYYMTLDAPCPSVQECIAAPVTLHRPCPSLDGCLTGTTYYTAVC